MRKSMQTFVLGGLLVTTTSLAGCAVDSDAAAQYVVSKPLSIKMNVPKDVQPDAKKKQTFEATVWREAKPAQQVDYVHFEIWKADGTVRYNMEPAEETKPGVYTIAKTLPKSGLYYVKAHASSEGAMIMPTRQFIVGKLSAQDLKILQGGAKPAGGSSGHHH
ncbi:FixH family protein [uncultured Exiguobacterium sp.]|uniref:FixH family protein n=1 Tax=uncultured Exiguobacterium sp. TaxID=202669 RepID=UPI0025F9261B|nr:FixH family protein [uncultured Exiguobacterium sp.]